MGLMAINGLSFLSFIINLFKTNFEEAHNAMIDIKATSKCFWELVKKDIIKLNNSIESITPENYKPSTVRFLEDLNDPWMAAEKAEIELIPYRKGNKWGYCVENKDLKIPCIYNYVKIFTSGISSVFSGSFWGYIDKNGTQITPFKYVKVWYVFDEMAGFQDINRGYGFINKSGREIVNPIYDDISSFSEGLAPVKLNGKWGFVNKDGDVAISFLFDKAKQFHCGLSLVANNGKYGFVNQLGNLIIPYTFEEADDFYENRSRVKYKGKWGFIDNSGDLIIKHKFIDADNFNEGFASVQFGGIFDAFSKKTWGYINKNGEQVFQDKFEHTHGFSEGYAAVKLNDRWGFINDKGIIRIPCNYNYAVGFHNGLARIDDISGKYGFIDKSNKMVIPLIYESAEVFKEGFSEVKKNNRDGYINTEGVEFWED